MRQDVDGVTGSLYIPSLIKCCRSVKQMGRHPETVLAPVASLLWVWNKNDHRLKNSRAGVVTAEEKRWKEQERTTNGLGNASWIDESDVQLLIEGKILLFSLGENSGCQSDDKDWFTTFELNKMRKISSKVDMTIKAGGKK